MHLLKTPMFATLFAVRSSWIAILLILVGILVVWFVCRAMMDAITWFREEIVEDLRERRQAKRARKAKGTVEPRGENGAK